MNEVMNSTNQFEFVEERISTVADETPTFDEPEEELEEPSEDIVDRSEVVMFTKDYRIRGKVSLVPGARLTDYMVEAHQFMAVTEVEVRDRQGNFLLKTPFLDINRDHIVLILPAELATMKEH